MITIKCSKCGSKIIRYNKIGEGRILRCYKDRIVRTYSILDEKDLTCVCGQVIGIDRGAYYKMKLNRFDYSGTIIRK